MTSIILEVQFSSAIQRIAFGEDRTAAEMQMNALQKMIGQERWGRNGEESASYRVLSPAGPVDVVCNRIDAVRLIDLDEHKRLLADYADREIDKSIDYEVRRKTALAAASVLTEQAEKRS